MPLGPSRHLRCGAILLDKEAFQDIEPLLPEFFVVADPFHAGMHGRCIEMAYMLPPLDTAADQAGTLQHLDMLGDSVERHVEWRRQFTDRQRRFRQCRQHRPPGRIGQRMEDVVKRMFAIFNHADEYMTVGRNCQPFG